MVTTQQLAEIQQEVEKLTAQQELQLKQLEKVISDNIEAFERVGAALAQIRDLGLFRARFRAFKEYCDQRWGFSDRRARQLIEAAKWREEVISSVSTDEAPKTERQARRMVGAARRRRACTETGVELTPAVEEALAQVDSFREVCSVLNRAVKMIEDLADQPAGKFLRGHGGSQLKQVRADLRNAREAIKFATPAGPCVYCAQQGCKACKKQGWLPAGLIGQAPGELKK